MGEQWIQIANLLGSYYRGISVDLIQALQCWRPCCLPQAGTQQQGDRDCDQTGPLGQPRSGLGTPALWAVFMGKCPEAGPRRPSAHRLAWALTKLWKVHSFWVPASAVVSGCLRSPSLVTARSVCVRLGCGVGYGRCHWLTCGRLSACAVQGRGTAHVQSSPF